ncbi:hypothetical protein Taro_036631 [Colocasia esculenta]|uniref:Apple domain-containing protein n=1 Tax=Colocasia esculenta TaxID=4460 RepID=A0A843VY30_COLES|nr:hypothetical protein [Colocasia esculenta]
MLQSISEEHNVTDFYQEAGLRHALKKGFARRQRTKGFAEGSPSQKGKNPFPPCCPPQTEAVLPSPSVRPPFAEDISGDLCASDQCDGVSPSRPTPATALLIILWIPLGILLAFVRILIGVVVPLRFLPYFVCIFGGEVTVRGQPPPTPTSTTNGVLFVCTHCTLMDPVVLALVLGRRVPAVTYSISRQSEILSPIPTIRLSRDRWVDSDRIKAELARGDLVVCTEGTTFRGPGSHPRTSATGLAPAAPSASATPTTPRDGCARKTALDCRNGTDGFVRVAGAKLPDTSAAVVNYTMGLGECRAACLRNCSCTAYASAYIGHRRWHRLHSLGWRLDGSQADQAFMNSECEIYDLI